MEILFLLWATISLIGCSMIFIDKYNAVHHQKRISERTLILTACFGAALPMWISMYLIHHKTKHLKFTIGLPLIMAIHLMILFICLH